MSIFGLICSHGYDVSALHCLLIFNTIGDANYKEVRNEFYSNVDGLILMYDVTDKQSFEALPNWLDEARQFGLTSSDCTMVVVGNKIDQYPRVVTEQQVSVYQEVLVLEIISMQLS